jgi:GAF domain-containing protein
MTDFAADDAASLLTRSTIEEERLHALRRCEILDTPPEAPFDRIVRLAARMFGAPVALISFVDRNRQWFKAGVGVAFRETSRDVAFCAHAIQSDEVFVVLDTTKSNLFVLNPLVTGSPSARFYAGASWTARRGRRSPTMIGRRCAIS